MSSAGAYMLVALGGAIGSVARYAGTLAAARAWGADYPWGTIAINVGGSFLISFFGLWTMGRWGTGGQNLRILVMVGFCGGFTTFSSFSLQTLELMQAGRWQGAAWNIVLSVALCLGAVAAGAWLGTAIGGKPQIG
ncbi:MAG TPA: fluoride efflux transporter CrcB [Acetobacteraceae bacterium]|nr:fluoride efflux transporter CrcB [Acetobacteraceae bacterium]